MVLTVLHHGLVAFACRRLTRRTLRCTTLLRLLARYKLLVPPHLVGLPPLPAAGFAPRAMVWFQRRCVSRTILLFTQNIRSLHFSARRLIKFWFFLPVPVASLRAAVYFRPLAPPAYTLRYCSYRYHGYRYTQLVYLYTYSYVTYYGYTAVRTPLPSRTAFRALVPAATTCVATRTCTSHLPAIASIRPFLPL